MGRLTYDAAWNMTARTNGTTVNYGVNNLNQVTGDGGTYTYTCDSTSTGSPVGWYRYDAFGRLLLSSCHNEHGNR